MYSELEEIFFVSMSNSDCILVKEEQLEADVNNFNIVKKPTLEIQLDECHVEEEEERIVMSKQVESTSLEEKLNVEEDGKDDDGFRTPTSLDQRIPVTKQCPLAPRKPRPSLKRKTFNNITHKNSHPT
ncbi:cyclin-dependent protein kinase inhibitor SMR3 [Quillaja saponaria]|uniref:Cyclin-dependent protein kinase inhibitor SMR3 n=1 Tax=Quillaja saponaria TaxID=32244 RepID=A0AAD7LNL6_QUISA|nr:cyclin-dependent protein kinase inhibitor SMR3 [Quillaja saponaria]